MDRKRKIMVFLLVILGLATYGRAAERELLIPVPVFTEAEIQSQLTYDSITDIYTYNYTISNPATNTGKIWTILIDISLPPDGIVLSSEGLITPRGGEIVTFEELLPKRLEFAPVVPVGMRLPYGWHGGVTVAGTARFAVDTHASEILHGDTLGGFEIISRGLPAIREVSIKPWWIYSTEGYADEEGARRAREIEASITYKAKTLGPTAPPADFKPLEFLDYIISLKHEAFQLGWIKNAGIENSLDKKLGSAKKSLEKGSTTSAKNILSAFVNEVEAQGCATYENCPSGKHLTPEAYGLLKYNVEYLMDRL